LAPPSGGTNFLRQVNSTLNEDKRLAKFLKRPRRVASKERESLLNTENPKTCRLENHQNYFHAEIIHLAKVIIL